MSKQSNRNLKTLLFFVFLISGLLAATLSTKRTEPSDFQVNDSNKCYLASAIQLKKMLENTVKKFNDDAIDGDKDVEQILNLTKSVSRFQASKLAGTATPEEASEIIDKYRAFVTQRGKIEVFEKLSEAITFEGKDFSDYIKALFNSFKLIIDSVSEEQQRPFYFKKDLTRSIIYSNKYMQLEKVSEPLQCVPPKILNEFDRLSGDLNSNNIDVEAFTSNSLIITQKLIEKGRLFFSFWLKSSLTNHNKGNTSVFKYAVGTKEVSLNLEVSESGNSVNLVLVVGNKRHVFPNKSTCSDLILVYFVITKEYDEYSAQLIVRSTINSDRQEAKIFLPTSFVEYGTLVFPSSSLVNINQIYRVKTLCSQNEFDWIQEVEISTQITDSTIKVLQNLIQDQCDSQPQSCEFFESGVCAKCVKGLFLSQGSCVEVCPKGLYGNIKNGECSSCDDQINFHDYTPICKENEFTFKSKCLLACPVSTYQGEDKICHNCEGDCEVCTSSDSCSKCKNGFLINGKCVDFCPKGFFPQYNPNICTKCCTRCTECSYINICSECKEGKFLFNDLCIKQCPESTFEKDGKCLHCPERCALCDDNENCLECIPGTTLKEGKCHNDCPIGTSSNNGVCLMCGPNCNECVAMDTNICIKCKPQFFLKKNECVEDCGPSSYADERGNCRNCLHNCEICNDSATCKKCAEGFFYYLNQCIANCPSGFVGKDKECVLCDPDSKCKSCQSANLTNCSSCFEGMLLFDGKCTNECPAGHFAESKVCSKCTANCAFCSNNLVCNECNENYFIKDGSCVEECGDGFTSIFDTCSPCNILGCSDCSGDRNSCKVCKQPYYFFNGNCLKECPRGTTKDSNDNCVSCIDNCLSCATEATCSSCNEPFVLLTDNTCGEICADHSTNVHGKCEICNNPRCRFCSFNLNTCTSCLEGEFIFNGDCLSACPVGTYTDGFNCIECSLPCSECSETSDNCTSCISSFILENGKCLGKCESGEVEISGNCKKCLELTCHICSSTQSCDKCSEGFYLLNNKCLDVCPENYYSLNGSCAPCLKGCVSCISPDRCKTCQPEFSFLNGLCVEECPSGYVSSDSAIGFICEKCGENCLECRDSNRLNCVHCEHGTFLLEGQCVSMCPNGYFSDHSLNKCTKCEIQGCSKCDEQNSCTMCEDNKLILNSSCVEKCPMGYRQDGRTCEKCTSENCLKCCSNSAICTQCEANSYLNDDFTCLKTCPDGKFAYELSKTCQPCDQSCKKCTDSQICTECATGFYLLGNTCVSKCPEGTIRNIEKGLCEPCNEECQVCLDGNSKICLKCKEGFFLYEAECVENCPSGYFENEDKRKCKPCPVTCLECKSENVCDKCKKDYLLNKGKCEDLCCPEYFTKVNGKCTKCLASSDCLKCPSDDLTKCLDCGQKILFKNRCLDICPDGYRKLSNNTCEKCISNCKLCSNNQTCNECNQPYVLLSDSTCAESCITGFVNIDGRCAKCNDSNCKVCDESKECLVCKEGFLLKDDEAGINCVEACGKGYFEENGNCVRCKDLNCLKCNNRNDCLECNNELILLNYSECVTICPDGKTIKDGFCVNCEAGCSICSQEENTLCLDCISPLVLHDGNCLDRCPERMVQLTTTPKTCTNCADNCLICSSLDKNECLNCEKGYAISQNGTCTVNCDEGYSIIEGKCEKCLIEGCANCEGLLSSCKTCIASQALSVIGDSCIPSCPLGQYFKDNKCNYCVNCPICEDENGKCTQCNPGSFLTSKGTCQNECNDGQVKVEDECESCRFKDCKVCSAIDLDSCLQCLDGKIMYNNQCIDNCPQKTYNYQDFRCLNCGENCASCLDASSCVKCDSSFVLQGETCQNACNKGFYSLDGVCVECGDSERCAKCDKDNKFVCKTCKLGYALLLEKCVDDCGCGYYVKRTPKGDICAKCRENCNSCKDNLTCDRCDTGFILLNNKCVSKCPSSYALVGGECKKCTNSLCISCSVENQDICFNCKKGYFLKDSQCLENCGTGYFANEKNECIPCSDNNCLVCGDSGTSCTDCKDGFYVFNGQCIGECPNGYIADILDICQSCNSNRCKICQPNLSVCLECFTGFLFEGNCVKVCPLGYFGDSGVCHQCPTNCLDCKSGSECTLCADQTILKDGICTTGCPPKSILIDGVCKKCEIDNCFICVEDFSACAECTTKSLLFNGECVESCPQGYFSDGKKCIACEEKCLACKNSTECITCDQDTYLFKGSCLNICPEFTYGDDSERKCKYCTDSERCIKCLASDPCVCEECRPGFVLGGICVDNCPPHSYYNRKDKECIMCSEHCDICNSGECDKCEVGFILFDSKCYEECPVGYVYVNNTCEKCDNGCSKCSKINPEICEICLSSFIFYDNQCYKSCPPRTFQFTNDQDREICKQCGENCQACANRDSCVQCDEEFVLLNGKCVDKCPETYVNINEICIKCGEKCETCNKKNIDECKQCLPGFFNNEGLCVEKCLEGFFPQSDRSCEKCHASCKNCKNETECTTCLDSLVFIENEKLCNSCQLPNLIINNECRSCKVPHCELCSKDENICSFCAGSFVLLNGSCQENCPNSTFKVGQECVTCDFNCSECASKDTCKICELSKVLFKGNCIDSCPAGFGKNDKNQCVKCESENCERCNGETPEICEECLSNYFILKNKCIKECPQSTFKTTFGCDDCSPFCKSCEAENNCNLCMPTYYLKDGHCTNFCGDGHLLDNDSQKCIPCSTLNCKVCNNKLCELCNEGFFFFENECVLQCPEGYFKNDNKCEKCSYGCLICSNFESCIKCEDNLIKFTEKCVASCPTGTTRVNDFCETCSDSTCEVCAVNSPDICIKCSTGILLGSTCVDVCPKGYFKNEDNSKCVECDPKCIDCVSLAECKECNPEFELINSKCKNTCDKGMIRNSEGDCISCGSENCEACILLNGTPKCIACSKNILYEGNCIDSCPIGLYEENDKCVNCQVGCKSCTSANSCTECNEYLFLNDGKCDSECPENWFANFSLTPIACEKCHENCYLCVGPSADKCNSCVKGFILVGSSCIKPEEEKVKECNKGFFLSKNNECEKCDTHCLSCRGLSKCTVCSAKYDLQDGICIKGGDIETVFMGTVLQSPFSIGYNEKHVIELNDYETISSSSKTISIFTWIRDLGTRISIGSSIESIIYIYSATDIEFQFFIEKPAEYCKLRFIFKGETTVIDSELDCSSKALFNWSFLIISIHPEDDGQFKIEININGKSYSTSVSLNAEQDIINKESKLVLLSKESSRALGSQISKITISNFLVNDDMIKKFSKNPPEISNWDCSKDSSKCSGFITLDNEFAELGKEYKLLDIAKLNIYDSAYKTFGTSLFYYADKFSNENLITSNIISIIYPYSEEYSIRMTYALVVRINSSTTEARARNNIIEIPEGIVEENQWYYIEANIEYGTRSTRYTLKINNGVDGSEIFNFEALVTEDVENYVKLFIDATVIYGCSNVSGQIYNPILMLGSETSHRIQTIKELSKDLNCKNFIINFACSQCNSYYILENDGICKDDSFNRNFELFSVITSYNNSEEQVDIPSELENKDKSIVFSLRKLSHSVNSKENKIVHDILKLGTDSQFITAIKESIDSNFQSELTLDSSIIKADFGDVDFPIIGVAITYSKLKSQVKIYINYNDDIYNSELNIEGDLRSIKLFDTLGIEINFEALKGVAYPKILSEEELKIVLNRNVGNSDPVCLESDMNDNCLKCSSKLMTEKRCATSLFGLSFFQFFGVDDSSLVSSSFYLNKELKNSVNSQHYAITARFRLFNVLDMENMGFGNYNIISLENDVRNGFEPFNPSLLLTARIEVKGGKGQLVFIVGNSVGQESFPVENFELIYDQWVFILASVQTVKKSFTYFVITKDFRKTETLSLKYFPERLQNSGKLEILDDKLISEVGTMHCFLESIHNYLIPNPPDDIAKLANLIESNDKYKPITPDQIENCKYSSYNPVLKESVCLVCKENYEYKAGICVFIPPRANGYELLNDASYIKRGLTKYELSYPFSSNHFNFVAYFRINNYIESKVEIFAADDLVVSFLMEESQAFIVANKDSKKIGPFDPLRFKNWNYIYLSIKEDKIKICVRACGIEDLSPDNCINFSNISGFPVAVEIDNSNYDIQVFGEQTIQYDYGVPVIDMCNMHTCNSECTACKEGVCYSSPIEIITDGKLSYNFVPIAPESKKSFFDSIILENTRELLRTDAYSLKFKYYSDFNSESTQVFRLELGSKDSFLELRKINNKDYSLRFSNYFINKLNTEPSVMILSLPQEPQSSLLGVLITVNYNSKIGAVVYENANNFIYKSGYCAGSLNYLTNKAQINYNDSVKEFQISYTNTFPSFMIQQTLEDFVKPAQKACLAVGIGSDLCIKCKREYIVAESIDKSGKGCALKSDYVQSFSHTLNKVNDKTREVLFEGTSGSRPDKYKSFSYLTSIHTRIPVTDSNKKFQLYKINSGSSNTIISAYIVDDQLIISNQVSGKEIAINGILTPAVRNVKLSIAVAFEFETGTTEILTYCHITGQSSYGISKGKAQSYNLDTLGDITLFYGSEDKNTINIRYLGSDLYFNSIINKSVFDELVYDLDSLPEGDETKFEFQSIESSENSAMFTKLKGASAEHNFSNYKIELQISETSNIQSGDVLFILSNSYRNEDLDLTKADILPEFVYLNSLIAIKAEDDNLKFYSNTSQSQYVKSLLPETEDPELSKIKSFKNINIQISVNSLDKSFHFQVTLDNVTNRIYIKSKNLFLEGLNSQSIIHTSQKTESAIIELTDMPISSKVSINKNKSQDFSSICETETAHCLTCDIAGKLNICTECATGYSLNKKLQCLIPSSAIEELIKSDELVGESS